MDSNAVASIPAIVPALKELWWIGGAFVGVVIWVYKLHASADYSKAKLLAHEERIDAISKESRENAVEIRVMTQSLAVRMESIDEKLNSIQQSVLRIDEEMLTKDATKLITNHYDSVAEKSEKDRTHIHARIDDLQEKKMSKTDHSSICRNL